MTMHPIGGSSEQFGPEAERAAALRKITAEQLLYLGTSQLVYLKSGMCNGKQVFLLYGAHGIPLKMVDAADAAAVMAAERGLELVAVH